MKCLVLLMAVLCNNHVHAGFITYNQVYGDLTVIEDSDKTTFTTASALTCSLLASQVNSNVFCHSGSECVVVSKNPVEMFDVSPADGYICYWSGM